MKVLITGASGKLAGFVIREVREHYQLVLTSRRKPDAEFSELPWIKGDLNSFSDCQQAVDGIEAIQHLGAQPNPVDHPHGGGEGRTSGGRNPVTPWGVPTRGHKTRNNKRTDKFIVRRRK